MLEGNIESLRGFRYEWPKLAVVFVGRVEVPRFIDGSKQSQADQDAHGESHKTHQR